MKTQQEMIRQACAMVLKRVPAKGAEAKEAFTPEVREAIADYMIPLLGVEWDIKSEFTKSRARLYITGKGGTDLLESWCYDRKRTKVETAAPVGVDKMTLIKQALDAGLITKEQAAEAVTKLLLA